MVITFCGHAKFYDYEKTESKLLSLLDKLVGDKDAELFVGVYGNFDSFVFNCAKKYKLIHPNARIMLIIPYPDASKYITPPYITTKDYDEIIYPGLEDKPQRFAITYCNKWMVDCADIVISYVTHTFGGAYKTYTYAKRKRKKIYNLPELETV